MSIQLKKVGQRIASHREKKGLNQTDVSENVGVTSRTLSKIEHGADMKLSTLFALADSLNVCASELVAKDEHLFISRLSLKDKDDLVKHIKAIHQIFESTI